MHSLHEDTKNRQPDFIVEYEIDLCDDPQVDGIYMIWPELLDDRGLPIEEKTPGSIPLKGKANMWIVSEEMRGYHLNRLKIGTKGYWIRGPFRVANVTVIKIGEMSC